MINLIQDNLLLEYALTQFADNTKIIEKYTEDNCTGYQFSDIKFTYENKKYKCGIDGVLIKDRISKEAIKNEYNFIVFHCNDKWRMGRRAFEFNIKEIEEVYPLQVSRLINAITAEIKICKLPIKTF